LPSEYGFVAMITVITNFASIMSGIGLGAEIIRSNYKYTFHKAMIGLSLYLGIVLCILVMAMAYPIALFYDNNKLILPTMIIATQFMYKAMILVQHALLMKQQKYTLLGKLNLYATILTIVLMILMAYFGFSYWSLIIPLIIADFYKLYIYNKNIKIKIRFYPFKYTRVAFNKSKSIMGSLLGTKIVSYWAGNLDNMLIGKFFGESSLGLYNRGYRFLSLSRKLIDSIFGQVLYPDLQKLKDNKGNVHNEYLFFIGVISFLSFPIGAVLVLIPDLFVRILWGPDWMEVAKFLPYFGLIILTRVNFANADMLFKLFYRETLLFKLGIFNSFTMVVSIVVGILFSATMVARLLALAHILVIMPTTIYFGFMHGIKFNKKTILALYIPRIIILAGILFSVWQNHFIIKVALTVLYFLHLIFAQRNELNRLRNLLVKKIRKK
jgi:PST family polysaccharide transporter